MHAELEVPDRVYFSVLAADGLAYPAVEYWAASVTEGDPRTGVAPLKRFIKLVGSNEALEDEGEGVFRGARSGRRFQRIAPKHAAEADNGSLSARRQSLV